MSPGTPVVARIGNALCGQTTVAADSTYRLDVPSAALSSGCGVDGATVNFLVGGIPAGSAVWLAGAVTQRELAVEACSFRDSQGRGTSLMLGSSAWQFSGPGLLVSGTGRRVRLGSRVMVFGRSSGGFLWGSGLCPTGPGQFTLRSRFQQLRVTDGAVAPQVPPTPTPTPVLATPTPPSPPTGETVNVGPLCNPVAATWPDGTPVEMVALATTPPPRGTWKANPGAGGWLGYSGEAPLWVRDLAVVNRLDAIFVCMDTSGTLIRPII